MNKQIRYSSGGTLVFDPPQHGRPSAATVSIYDPNGAEHVAPAPTVTIDSVNTTLNGAASEGDTSLTLTSAAGIVVGRYYDLEASDGRVERFRAAAVSGAVVTLAEELGGAYADGSAVTGNRLTATIASGDADPLDEGYEARWSYTIDATAYYANTLFDVVRSPWPDVVLRPHEFRQYTPGLSGPHNEASYFGSVDFGDELEIATERVRVDIAARGMRPDLFRSFDHFKRPIAYAVIVIWAEAGINMPAAYVDQPELWLETRREVYARALDDALNVTRSYDADDSGTVTDSEREKRLGILRWRL